MKNNYHDMYFEHHHWLLKIRQTLIMLLSWCILLIPIIITISTYLAYRTNGHQGHFFWYYAEGFRELNFLVIILLFALGIIGGLLHYNGIYPSLKDSWTNYKMAHV